MWGMRKQDTMRRADSCHGIDTESQRSSTLVSSEGTSSLTSRANSQGSNFPSRMNSFSSNTAYGPPKNDIITQTSFDTDLQLPLEPLSPMSSSESSHSHSLHLTANSGEPSTVPSESQEGSEVNEAEDKPKRTLSPTILKWVDESRIELERQRSSGELMDSEMSVLQQPDKCQPQVDQDPATLLDTASNELMLQRALQLSLHRVSPTFARAGSMDGNFGQWTSAESLLMGLGFGGPDLGIPARFLKSWREQVMKRQLQEIQTLLGRPLGSLSPTESLLRSTSPQQFSPQQFNPQDTKSSRSRSSPSPVVEKPKKSVKEKEPVKEKVHATPPKQIMEPSEKEKQFEKLRERRRNLKKSATFASFTPNQLSGIKDLNQSLTLSSSQNNEGKKSHDSRKYRRRPSLRGNARDRRRKFAIRQSSLPTSLEPLPEEDETRPSFMHQKSSSLDFLDKLSLCENSDSNILMSLRSFEMESKLNKASHPQIITHQASDDLSKPTSSVSGETESSSVAEKGTTKPKSYLQVIKGKIGSKDSGIGNDLSIEGSPDLSPKQLAGDYMLSDAQDTINVKDDGFEESGSHEIISAPGLEKSLQPANDTRRNVSVHVVREFRSRKDYDVEQSEACIQVDIDSDHFDEEDGDMVEVICASVQTSPWLHSPLLSPLMFQQDDLVQQDSVDSMYKSGDDSSERQSTKPAIKGGLTIPNIEKDGKILDSQEYDSKPEPKNLETDIQNKQDMLFFPEKRRLSRIDEVTEHSQSQESELKSSIESQNESVSSSSSYASNANTSSMEWLTVQDGQGSQHSRRKNKAYKDMLRLNVEQGLTEAEKMVLLNANSKSDKWKNALSIRETLEEVAAKLRVIADENRNVESLKVDQSDGNDRGRHVEEDKTDEESVSSSNRLNSKSISSSPDVHTGSRRARQFFYNSLNSFSESARHLDESGHRSRINSLTSELSDNSAFFGTVNDADVMSEESGMNFSLTGNDMNLMEDDNFDSYSIIGSSISGKNSDNRYFDGYSDNHSSSSFSASYSHNSFSVGEDDNSMIVDNSMIHTQEFNKMLKEQSLHLPSRFRGRSNSLNWKERSNDAVSRRSVSVDYGRVKKIYPTLQSHSLSYDLHSVDATNSRPYIPTEIREGNYSNDSLHSETPIKQKYLTKDDQKLKGETAHRSHSFRSPRNKAKGPTEVSLVQYDQDRDGNTYRYDDFYFPDGNNDQGNAKVDRIRDEDIVNKHKWILKSLSELESLEEDILRNTSLSDTDTSISAMDDNGANIYNQVRSRFLDSDISDRVWSGLHGNRDSNEEDELNLAGYQVAWDYLPEESVTAQKSEKKVNIKENKEISPVTKNEHPHYISEVFIYINGSQPMDNKDERSSNESNLIYLDSATNSGSYHSSRQNWTQSNTLAPQTVSVHNRIISKTYEIEALNVYNDNGAQVHQPFRYSSKYYLQLQQSEESEYGWLVDQAEAKQRVIKKRQSFIDSTRREYFTQNDSPDFEGRHIC